VASPARLDPRHEAEEGEENGEPVRSKNIARPVWAVGRRRLGEFDMDEVIDNAARGRFELIIDGQTAYANYRREPGRLLIPYVEAPPALRGTGAAGRLMEGVLAQARMEGRKVVPICSYAAAYIRRHKPHHDLLD
jgi:predicted GNAT family acetyltransferase